MSHLDLDIPSFLKSMYKEFIIKNATTCCESLKGMDLPNTWWGREMYDTKMVNKIEIRDMDRCIGTGSAFGFITEKGSSNYIDISLVETSLKVQEYIDHHNINVLPYDQEDLRSFQMNPKNVLVIDTGVRAWYDLEVVPYLQTLIEMNSL